MTTHLDQATRLSQLAADVRHGLSSTPKTLPPKYFYDARGSELFDEITRLPEYYPTRTERQILTERADEIAAITSAELLVEIGSGTSDKTRLLLHALTNAGTLRRFVPFDVDPAVLGEAAGALAGEFPGLAVEPVVGDFERHLHLLPRGGRRLVAFLGSTIGNLQPQARVAFLSAVRATMGPGDALLLGTDLVKPVSRLLAAYDDGAGVTAEFNKNVLAVVNRELGADFDLDAFEHVVRWDAEDEWIEMHLRSVRQQRVHVPSRDVTGDVTAELVVDFGAGELMRTEISAKFRHERVAAELSAAGLELTHWFTDAAEDFAVSLSRPV